MGRTIEQVIIMVQGEDDASAVFRQVAAEMGKMTSEGKKGLGILDGIVLGLGQKLTGLAMQAPAVAAEFVQLGARAEAASHRFTAFAGGAAEADEMLAAFLEGTEGASDRMTAMSSAAKLLQMGLVEDADTMELVAAMATKLGDQTDSVTNRVSGFALMLSNTSVPRLDNYGISSGKVRARIKELQDQIADLSREEAFKIATLEEGSKALKTMGDTSDLAATELDKLKASITNLKVAMAEEAAEAAKTPLAWANVQLQGAELRNELVRMQDELVALNMIAQEEVDAFDQLETKMKFGQASSEELTAARAEELERLRGVRSEYEASTGVMDSWQRAMLNAAPAIEEVSSKSATLRSILEGKISVIREVTGEWYALAEAVGGRLGPREGFEVMGDSLNELMDGFKAAVPELEEMREEQQKLADEAHAAAAALGDEFVGYLGDATDGADSLAMAMFEAGDASGWSHDQLAALAGQLGIASDMEIEAALQATVLRAAMLEMADAVVAGTMSVAQAAAALAGLRAELPAGIALLEQQASSAHSYAGASRSMSDADREAARRQRELQRELAKTGDYFMDALGSMGAATAAVGQWEAALFSAADAEGASARQLALLAGEMGLYSEETIEAALKTAAMQEKVQQLARQVARGLSAQTALARLRGFQAEIFGVPGLQSGTQFWSGGPAIVGEGTMAGELVVPPRGSAVYPASMSRHVVNNLGGDQYHIYDTNIASQVAAEKRRRQRQARAGALA